MYKALSQEMVRFFKFKFNNFKKILFKKNYFKDKDLKLEIQLLFITQVNIQAIN